MSTAGISTVLTNINNAFSGKTSGIDVTSTVAALMQLQRAPELQMQQQQVVANACISLLGAIASDLSQLQTAANNLKDSFGALSQKTITSSDASIVTATAKYSAATGTHNVVVSQLATISSSYSEPVTDVTALAGSTLTVVYGNPEQPAKTDNITLAGDFKGLQDVADAINKSASNTGVTASVVSDAKGERIALVSKSSGADGNLTVSGPVTFHQGVEGKNALLRVDGVPVENATNTITGALSGITLQLSSADPETTVQVDIAPDTTEAANAVNSFITAYNNVLKDINGQFAADSSGNAGPLAGDASLRNLQSQLLEVAGYSPGAGGKYVNLQSLGIEMQNDGTLQMSSTKLEDVLTNHFADFQNFFQSTDPTSYGQTVSKMLLKIADPTDGTLAVDIKAQKAINADLTQHITDFEDRMTEVQKQLMAQYSQLNILLQRYPSQIQQINLQLSALSPNSNK